MKWKTNYRRGSITTTNTIIWKRRVELGIMVEWEMEKKDEWIMKWKKVEERLTGTDPPPPAPTLPQSMVSTAFSVKTT